MKGQRKMLICQFGVLLGLLFSVYYYLLRGGRPTLWWYSVDHYRNKSPIPYVRRCNIYYDSQETGRTKSIASALYKLLAKDEVVTEVLDVGRYKHAKTMTDDGTVTESFDDLLDISGEFSVVLRYIPEPTFKGDFEVAVNGGRSMVVNIAKAALTHASTAHKVYDLINGIFFKYDGMPSTRMTPIVDISFVLMSDNQKVGWNVKDDIIDPFFYKIAGAISVFYDVSIHSRVISGANLTSTMKLKDGVDENRSFVDLQEQGTRMFDLLDRVTSVEVGTRDSSIYRHTLAFVCHIPHKELRFYDRAMQRETDSVMINGLGIISLFDLKDQPAQEYQLTGEDTASLMSSWITHIRKMHNLPPTLTDTLLEGLQPEDEVTIIKDGHYLVRSPKCTFSVRLANPGAVAFYGFEISKIAESLYKLYLKGALDNLHKVVKPLSSISFMTRVSKAAVNNIKQSHAAISRLYGRSVKNMDALALARTAFKQSLEAMGDDETYAKNVVSVEHGFALFMCDVFPFLFPLLVNGLRCAFEK